jgi:hypothetical protein
MVTGDNPRRNMNSFKWFVMCVPRSAHVQQRACTVLGFLRLVI